MNSADSETSPSCRVPLGPALRAPAHWRQIDFISDLHLQASEPGTFECWQRFMHTTQADALFILGDLFEVWVGDDIIDPASSVLDSAAGFEARCGQVLLEASRRLPVYFMHGNRDFLLGPAFATACGMTLLNDPTVLDFASQRWLLSHGDALCLDDTDYMNFRRLVRSPRWQSDFLSQPLAQRQETARNLRERSEQLKRSVANDVDLDTRACCDWLQSAHATTLIHGHTHQPADHILPDGLKRITLSDWDAAAVPPRAEVLRLTKPLPGTRQPKGTVQRLSAHHIKA